MEAFVLPPDVAAQLSLLGHSVELRDAAGRPLGTFTPAFDPAEYEIVGGEPTEAELREIMQSTKWHTTEEVLRHLESLS